MRGSPANVADSYFVTELLGTDLHRLLTSRPLERQFIQYFLYQIMVCLAIFLMLVDRFPGPLVRVPGVVAARFRPRPLLSRSALIR